MKPLAPAAHVSRPKATQPAAVEATYIGTAAWTNPPAERPHRAEGESHLQHYASRFNAVEINSSFYRSHQRDTYERWRETTPVSFRFSVKLPRSITHDSGLRQCAPLLRRFLQEVAGLGNKLRVILVQTPASLPFEPRVAARFFATLTASTRCQIACEPRHPGWFTAKAEVTLLRYSIARVAADPARVPDAAEPGGATRLAYYRLHGSPKMYYSAYDAEYLTTLSRKITASTARETWCIFDNTARHAAWQNATDLQQLVASQTRKDEQPLEQHRHT